MNYVTKLLTLQNQIRVWHWQSEKHSIHVSLGMIYDKLDTLIDSFIEEFSGEYGKIMNREGFNIVLKNINELNMVEFINQYIEYLTTEVPKGIKPTDTNLTNIRDTLISELQQLKYLLTLN
jgi:hypothetical protein